MKIKDKVFKMDRFALSYTLCKKNRGAYTLRQNNNLYYDAMETTYETPYSFGQVLSNELKVPMNRVFKLANDSAGEKYIIVKQGIHVLSNGVWHDVTNCFHRTRMFKRCLNVAGTPVTLLDDMLEISFEQGDIIAGIYPNTYGITNQRMTEGVVTSVNKETREMWVRVIKHTDLRCIGREYLVNMYNSNNEPLFVLVRKGC